MKATYLLIDLLTILLPLAFSFHPRISFYKHWSSYLPVIVLTALLFVVWDAYFTRLGVWRFNPKFLTGVYLGHLPIEEWLFFICIPYACLFTLYCLSVWADLGLDFLNRPEFTWFLIGLMLGTGIWKINSRYTASTFISLSLLLVCCQLIWKIPWLGRFYAGWLILLVPLVVVDGLLTGTGLSEPIVAYNEHDILGVRLGTIPLEDFLYGMELILLNLLGYEGIEKVRNSSPRQTRQPNK